MRGKFLLKSTAVVLFGLLLVVSGQSFATVVHAVSGVSSVTGETVSYKAELTISGDCLTIKLFNLCTLASSDPAVVLSSYYFDIVNGSSVRPTLTYVSATGDVYNVRDVDPDVLQEANADLRAYKDGPTVTNYGRWQFKAFPAASEPYTGFGIGTAGNSNLAGDGASFNGNITGGLDYSIDVGEVTTENLENKSPLVKGSATLGSATFVFSGLTDFYEDDISLDAIFGLGTAPDVLLTTYEPPVGGGDVVPEPLTMLGLFLGLGGVGAYIRRRRMC